MSNTDQFRNYTESSARHSVVSETYRLNHTLQTYQHVQDMKVEHLKFNKGRMSVWEAISKLDEVVDDSDPDNEFPQIYHALQTAETLRRQWPEHDWLHLVGLIHDLGKVLALPEFGGLPQWDVVGDTFPVGCSFSPSIVMPHHFAGNPDNANPLYNTLYGVYQQNCGLDNVHISWGHDEYMYQVCVHNGSTLPPAALKAIRYHSFYSWHRDGAYKHLMDQSDIDSLPWVQSLQKADLYSKADELPSVDALRPYYSSLIDKYFPNRILEW